MPRKRHPLSGAIYDVGDDGLVHVDLDGRTGVFTASGELRQADPHLCGWRPGRTAGSAGNPKAAATTSATKSASRSVAASVPVGDVVRHGPATRPRARPGTRNEDR